MALIARNELATRFHEASKKMPTKQKYPIDCDCCDPPKLLNNFHTAFNHKRSKETKVLKEEATIAMTEKSLKRAFEEKASTFVEFGVKEMKKNNRTTQHIVGLLAGDRDLMARGQEETLRASFKKLRTNLEENNKKIRRPAEAILNSLDVENGDDSLSTFARVISDRTQIDDEFLQGEIVNLKKKLIMATWEARRREELAEKTLLDQLCLHTDQLANTTQPLSQSASQEIDGLFDF